MTYEEFLDTELRDELRGIHYEPEHGVVYGTVDNGFIYREVYHKSGSLIALHLDDGTMRSVTV